MKKIFTVLGIGLLSGLLFNLPWHETARAAEFPSRPVELIINYAPGGTVDLAVRIMADELTKALGVPVILTNKAGGGGAVGTEFVARAKPDGYTVLASASGVFAILPTLNPNLHFTLADFIPLAKYTSSPNVIIVRKDSPYRSFADFIADAKKNPGKVTCATTGLGTANQLSMEVVKIQASIDIAMLPYKSGGEVNVALLGGHVDLASQGFSPALGLLKSGDIRALASLTGKIKSFPGVPSMTELGYPKADLSASSVGYLLPKGTPQPIVNKLAAAFKKAMHNPAIEKKLENAGQFLDYEDGPAFANSLTESRKALEEVAKKAKLVK